MSGMRSAFRLSVLAVALAAAGTIAVTRKPSSLRVAGDARSRSLSVRRQKPPRKARR